jgi:hypothetical protein
MAGTLEYFICYYEAPTASFSDHAKLKLDAQYKKSSAWMVFLIHNIDHIIKLKTLQNSGFNASEICPPHYLIPREHLPTYGYRAFSMLHFSLAVLQQKQWMEAVDD